MAHYDVFISYRRTSFESSNLISEKLRSMGYRIFFDVETLRSGKFNDQLLGIIENCTDFVLILPPNALDRCSDENDWVRKEVLHAIHHKKNIIPVMLSGFEWPETMPNGMEELSQFQCIKAGEQEFFDLSMKRLAGYLLSKPRNNLRTFYKKTAGVLLAIAILIGVVWGTLNIISTRFCTDLSMSVSNIMANLSVLRKNQVNYFSLWTDYKNDIANPVYNNPKDHEWLTQNIHTTLDKFEQDVANLKATVSRYSELTSYERFLISLHDIDIQDVYAFNAIFDSVYDDVQQFITYLKMSTKPNMTKYTINHANIMYDYTQYFLNTVYCSYLGFLSEMPKKCHEFHYTLLGQNAFGNFTIQLELGKDAKEYEAVQNTEFSKVQKCIQELTLNNELLKAEVQQQETMLQKGNSKVKD